MEKLAVHSERSCECQDCRRARKALTSVSLMRAERGRPGLRLRGALLLSALAGVNAALWVIVGMLARQNPLLASTALIAYGLGLRHAVDADHISAIDNTTRKLMQEGKKPLGVGFFFSLGHSTVVLLLCAALAVSSGYVQDHIPALQRLGSVVGVSVSAGFLYLIGSINLVVLVGLMGEFRRLRRGCPNPELDVERLADRRAGWSRWLAPMLSLVKRSWHMYPVGFVFGLGFDTASEVGILSLSVRSGQQHASLAVILLLPLLFTAAMCMVDTADGLLMVGTYGWAFVDPARKLFYNIVITGISVIAAFVVGALELLQVLAPQEHGASAAWRWVRQLDLGRGGAWLIGLFLLLWAGSVLFARNRSAPR